MSVRSRLRRLVPFALLGTLILSIAVGVSFVRAAPVNLQVSISDSVDAVKPGDRVSYRITIRNSSTTETLSNIIVRDLLPPANVAKFVNVKNGALAPDGLSVTCAIVDLAPGEEDFCYVTLDVKNPLPGGTTQLVNRVEVRANSDPDAATASDTDQITNVPPTASNDAATVLEDTATPIDVLENDSDPNGDPLAVQVIDGPQNGTYALSGGNVLVYTANPDYNGPDSLTYVALDGRGGQSTPATVTLQVTPVNDAPEFTPGADVTVDEDSGTYVGTGWTTNFRSGPATATDEVAQALTFVVTGNDNPDLFTGQPSVAGGTLQFTPAPDTSGTATITLVLQDDGGTANGGEDTSASQTFTITVNEVNDVPVAEPDQYNVDEDTTLVVNNDPLPGVLDNDTDIDSSELTVTLVQNVAFGTLTLNANGTFTYTPNANFTGTDSFTYTATDGVLTSAPVLVEITVDPQNDAPQAVDDSGDAYTTDEDTVLTVSAAGVLGNDTDVDGDSLTATKASDPTSGTVVLNANGSFTYTPNKNFSGTDSFTYTVSDGALTSAPATVTITVVATNDPPLVDLTTTGIGLRFDGDTTADGDYVRIPDDDSLDLRQNFTLEAWVRWNGANGYRVVLSKPSRDQNGITSGYALFLNDGAPGLAIMSSQQVRTHFTTTPVTPNEWVYIAASYDGRVSRVYINGALIDSNDYGSVAPAATDRDSNESTDLLIGREFQSGLFERAFGGDIADVRIWNVLRTDAELLNSRTTAVDPGASGLVGFWRLDEGNGNSAADLSMYAHTGSLGGGNANAVPAWITDGPGQIAYTENDQPQIIDPGALVLDDAPNARGGWLTVQFTAGETPEDRLLILDQGAGATNITLSGNDVLYGGTIIGAFDGGTDGATPLVVTFNEAASLEAVQALVRAITYINVSDAPSTDRRTVSFELVDSNESRSAAAVRNINVGAVNDLPVAEDDAYTTNEDTALTVDAPGVLANDTEPDGDPLASFLINDPSNGTVMLNPDGSFTYTPNADFSGSDSFTYCAVDDAFLLGPRPLQKAARFLEPEPATDCAAVGTVSITVNPVNDAPAFTKGADVTVDEDSGAYSQPWASNISAGPEDETTQTLTFEVTNSNGSLFAVAPALSSDGTLSFTPATNANGTATVTVRLRDNGGTTNGGVDTSAVETFTITINPVNDTPDVVSDTYDTNQDTPLTVNAPGVLTNDNDIDNDTLTAQLVQNPANGTLTLNPDGSFTYTPNAGYNGIDTFTYKANDGNVASNEVAVTINVYMVNAAPSFVAGKDITVAEDSGTYSQTWATAISAGANEPGQNVTFVVTNNNATLFSTEPGIDPDGTLNFVPGPDKYGQATVTVVLKDDAGTPADNTDDAQSAAQDFVITVTPVNDAPTAADDPRYSLNEDSTKLVAAPGVMTNDIDTDGDALSAMLVTGPSKGILTFNGDGSFSYTPNADVNGADSFTYRVSDPDGEIDTATVTLTITPVNDAPAFTKGANVTVDEDSGTYSQPWAQNIITGPANESSQAVAFQVSATNTALFANGPAIAADGSLGFTPALNKNGTSTVTVALKDDGGTANGGIDTSAAVTFTITVRPVNDAPVAGNDTATTPQNTALTLTGSTLLSNDSDVDGDQLTITGITQPTSGSATLNADGSVTFTPANNFTGSVTFTYTVNDGNGGTDSATVTIDVTASSMYQVFLPLVWAAQPVTEPAEPDLVGSFSLTPNKTDFTASEQVSVQVTVTNQGTASARGFWVDFYINPAQAPVQANVRWSDVCTLTPCYGLAWYVDETLAPGQSITLTSDATAPGQSIWTGAFAPGTSDLYLYVDSWNPGVVKGAILESDETNNRAELHGVSVTGSAVANQNAPDPRSIPARPQRLSK